MQFGSDEVHEFLSGVFVFQECSCEFRGGGDGVLLLNTAHGHAEVLGLDDHGHADGVEHFLQAILDLGGEAFL